MTEQQPEPEQHEARVVVHLVDGTVLAWPASITAFTYQEDGWLSLYRWDPETEKRGDLIAVMARGEWATAYDDGQLAS